MPLKLTTYHRGSRIPELPGTDTFHSTELFHVYEATPGYAPLLIVASENGIPVAKLLAAIRKSVRLFPPAIIKRCEVYGTGEYFDETLDREAVFSDMLQRLTDEALREAFLIEFRNLDNSLSGYKVFRENRYFAVNWLRVRNSLHPPNQKRAEQRSRSKRSAYPGRNPCFCQDAALQLLCQDTAAFPKHRLFPASGKANAPEKPYFHCNL